MQTSILWFLRNVSNDTAKVFGVRVGTGTLQADYAGGGGAKTATVAFTVSSTNFLANWSTGSTDDIPVHLWDPIAQGQCFTGSHR